MNLFGYDGQDPVLSATFSAEPALVDFMLRAGADPNHNPYPEDEPDLISAALDIAVTDAFLERDAPAGDGCEAIVRLIGKEPVYDVKVLDRLVTRVAREIRLLEQALEKAARIRDLVG